ncbi:MAG: hypothetical protein PHG08_00045 [Bacilli bacterium]|nr:hypothetical protein [Bacilli bacterium]
MYTLKFENDNKCSILYRDRIVVAGIKLCEALKIRKELNYLANIINILGEEII